MSRQYSLITKTNGEDYQMIHYIKGTLAMKLDTGIVVETGGIGYDISVPGNSSLYLRSEGDEVICYTAMIVREDDVSLYGFADRESLELFRILITVSGVGAKAAMAVLSALTSSQLRQAIAFEDDKAIATANGVGKKTAQRIVLELKDKVSADDVSVPEQQAVSAASDDVRSEAANGLVALGYSRAEAVNALAGTEAATVEEYIKKALKNLF